VKPGRPVVDLRDPRSWHAVIEWIVHRQIPPAVIAALRQVPAAKMYDDTMKYLDGALGDAGAEPVDRLLPGLQCAVSRGFSALRAFHGCKPVSLDSYYRSGITPLTRRWLVQEAFDLFEGSIPRAELQRVAAKADLGIRRGLVWFATDPDELTGLAGHYLVYGPESMNCLWQHDPARFRESQERQRQRGVPTLFECAVPMALIGREWKHELTKTLVTRLFKGRSVTPDPDGESGDWGFSVRRPVGPEHFIGHTHPAVIYDPLRHGIDYRNPVLRCPWCP
jgi:hypothetical protein